MRLSTLYLFALFLLALPALSSAGRVAIIADNGESVRTACASFSGSATAADVLKGSGLGVQLADYGPDLGEAVCKIGATGCEISNCFCDPNYWAFFYSGGGSWTSSEVGVSFHEVSNGELLGFRWTSWPPAEPEMRSFSDICPPEEGAQVQYVARHFEIDLPEDPLCIGEPIEMNVQSLEEELPVWEPSLDSLRRDVFRPIDIFMGTVVKVFYKNTWLELVSSGETDEEGDYSFTPPLPGTYNLELSKIGFVHTTKNLEVADCTPVPECIADSDCAYDQQCVQQACVQLSGYCGYVEDHEFVEYECCSDSACSASPVGGRCEDHRCVEPSETRMRDILRVLFNYYIY